MTWDFAPRVELTSKMLTNDDVGLENATDPRELSGAREHAVWDDPEHLRGQILTEEQLVSHAQVIASAHLHSRGKSSARNLRNRFRQTRQLIKQAYATLAEGSKRNRDPSPAELWLLDNAHVVEGQLREVDEDLPWGYLVKLPGMDRGEMRGYPLVYGLCLDYLRHTDCHLDFRSLTRFVDSYQTKRVLTIGELWAIPIMLRLGLVLSVGARASSEANANDRDLAEDWARRLLGPPRSPEIVSQEALDHQATHRQALNDLNTYGKKQTPSDALLVTLQKRLRERDDAPVEALEWIAKCTAELGTTPEELARRYHLGQAADQVSVGNAITSMRAINNLDWSVFFNSTSHVEAILSQDPSGAYPEMDDSSRDRCRHALERIARRSPHSETEVAECALRLSLAHLTSKETYKSHVGYYLIDAGNRILHAEVGYRPSWGAKIRDSVEERPARYYLSSIALLTLACATLAWLFLFQVTPPLWLLLLFVPPLLLGTSEIAVAIINALVITLLPPRILPKLDFKHGIPEKHRTLVVVPTMLSDSEGLTQLLEELEVRSLANADDHLHFALLTDFSDAEHPDLPGEAELLAQAVLAIDKLNAGRLEPRFFFFHRRRIENVCESNKSRRFWGWERKRGKLTELNNLLRGHESSFQIASAPVELLKRVRYVITLDTDTELPLGIARRLVGAMAHPLNRPWVDPVSQRVVRGHAIIQPRVGTSPMSARQSFFARLAAGPPGIDPYTTAVSDVYQDLFGEGSFVGKGIYDVDAFVAAMQGRVPENQLLSHDLFESIYARAALASDIEVLDEQPASYGVAAGRQHRWTRGDWQLLPWLRPRMPGETSARKFDWRAFDTWRVVDNLRRSLLAPALVVVAALSWFAGPAEALVGTAIIFAVFVIPVLGRLVFAFGRSDAQLEWLGGLAGDLKSNAQQALLSLIFLLDHAIVNLDAILRSLFRQLVSRQNLLEWTSMRDASQAGRSHVLSVPRLFVSSALSLAFALSLLVSAPAALLVAAPVLFLWFVSPWVSAYVSRIRPLTRAEPWGQAEAQAFRRISRKTWRFFERFVGEDDHHLPPDNFQEDPRGVVAHRTSPTNIGLYLLSVAAARDLGFISLDTAIRRWTATLTTIEGMERREGHILNWYDTSTLQPLEPRYISTVDSGNFAGYLWTLAEVCREARTAPLVSAHTLEAVRDAVNLAKEEATQTYNATSPAIELCQRLSALASRSIEEATPETLEESVRFAESEFRRELLTARRDDWTTEFKYWLEAAQRSLRQGLQCLDSYLPHLKVWSELGSELRRDNTPGLVEQVADLDALVRKTNTLQGISEGGEALRSAIFKLSLNWSQKFASDSSAQLHAFNVAIGQAERSATSAVEELHGLAQRAESLVDQMDFGFLYDEDRMLFSIGYNVGAGRLDNSHYDLLASEARLASLVAIAKGEVPEKHWFRLGRLRARYASMPGLLSWSGSMFEYLMPLLVTRSFPDTLLDQTYHAVIEKQMHHAQEFGVPWGISEAAYNVMDLGMTYQYRAFGVPETGLKSGLGEDLVVAPYATALAALVRTRAAAKNFVELSKAGLEGTYGYYESVDFTPSRLPPGRTQVVVKAFMAHHQGMTLVALANLLTDFSMQRRFHADPRIKACALLLEERIPQRSGVAEPETPRPTTGLATTLESDASEHLDQTQVFEGEVRGQLLGQSSFSTWVTSGGDGFTSWRGIDINRFREDPVFGSGGVYIYLRNLSEGSLWSSGYLPTRAQPSHYDVIFSIDKVELQRRDGDVETSTEIVLSPEHAAEIRRITLTNHGKSSARLDMTSFTELSLSTRSADIAHPAFQKMFVETEFVETECVEAPGALIAHRRKRSEHEQEIWVAQLLMGVRENQKLEHCTSRASFLGRGGTIAAPQAMAENGVLDGVTQPALDPALVLRTEVELQPGEQTRFSLITVAADSRAALMELIELFSAPHSVPRAFELAWADTRVELRHLNVTSSKAHRYQRLLSSVIFPQLTLRGQLNPPISARGRDALWVQGISGDLPIVVLRLNDTDFSELCRDLLLAHEYWRLNGFVSDLLILNEEPPGYLQPVHEAVLNLIRSTPAEGHVDQRGGVFVRRTTLISEEDLQIILSAARVSLSASEGSLSRQLRALSPKKRLRKSEHLSNDQSRNSLVPKPALLPLHVLPPQPSRLALGAVPDLLFKNDVGGFSPQSAQAASGEYVMEIGPGRKPPLPWSNVIAGPRFGALVTEAGSSFTWFENSQKYRLTPWSNDPTLDPSGELFFVRDQSSESSWSLTPAPAGGDATYTVRHGQGYSSFEHVRNGLIQVLTVSVSVNQPVKIWHISLTNTNREQRTLRLYGVVEWVLGNHRENLRLSTLTSFKPELHALLARNPLGPFPQVRAFFASTEAPRSYTADRQEFFGRWGVRERPMALKSETLSGLVGTGLDPAAALEVEVTLAAGETRELSFVLGAGADERRALELLAEYIDPERARTVKPQTAAAFREILGQIQVRTPDAAFDLLTNHWLLYQVLSCRFWGRSGFYQSGGAYGFRDQLQDSMALLHTRPDLAREHLLVSAARQFVEGDVQHWWHADTGEGVRTQCSDDLLWLPWAALEYASSSGDQAIWDTAVPFLQERRLEPGEDDLYSVPPGSEESATLYEHCVRAIDEANTQGPSGLPLMRAGDWNDGMSRVGLKGQGESVWLAWFLASILDRFAKLAQARGDQKRAASYRVEASRLSSNIDQTAWDGEWYRRATFDDGQALGSKNSPECSIDAIAQSWAVLSKKGQPERARQALDSSLRHLLDREEKMLLLLKPPFQGHGPDPGYIAAYPAGIRENGGQYTHGVLWTVLALLEQGRGDEGHEVLSMLNPIHHTTDSADLARYQVEPYVLAADVYSQAPHVGRGGWTWYTGSASWMYRISVEGLLGLRRHGDELEIHPCVPQSWKHFEVDYRTPAGATLKIAFENPEGICQGVTKLVVDGRSLPGNRLQFPRDKGQHQVSVTLGRVKQGVSFG